MTDWVTLDDGTGNCRENLAHWLPREGQRVLFSAAGVIHMGTFHPGLGSCGHFRSLGNGTSFRVAAGEPCAVSRWLGTD